MTFEEALAWVKKYGSWAVTKLTPQDRYSTIRVAVSYNGITYLRDYTLWAGVLDYRPGVLSAIIYGEQRQIAHAIVKKEVELNDEA
ncbi:MULTISPECIES: hypothetical protein [unclassified Marinobacter]|uniref:hypothetical protein n=1 Tax=unclassified Marinobacter TaxID=83889 RepID=UPI0012697894|nr:MULTISPECIES: hypothetical protein [unclassified Marinobacter]QFS87612.1 hypothetical protein FIV08_12335 [Marinobacter sp. THAF197a]QFT51397.1 hypothetical protein FIU96_12250 [Marinobacter sp. THAF39]